MIKPAPKSKKVAKRRKKSGSWKRAAQSRRDRTKLRNTVTRYIVVFSLFSVSFLGLISYVSYKKLTSPFVSASSYNSFNILSEDLYSLALISVDNYEGEPVIIEKADFLFFDIKNKKLLNYKIEPNVFFDVPGKYSEEELSKILGLGMSINDDDLFAGIGMTNKTLGNFFGYGVGRYIVVDSMLSRQFEEFFAGDGALPLNLEFLNELNSSVTTDLSIAEMYEIYRFVNQLPEDRIIKKTISDSNEFNTEEIDVQLRDLTFESKVALEAKSIAVLNGTDSSGAANFGSRVIENMGGRVIAVSNASRSYDSSVLIVDDPSSETVVSIARFFEISNIMTKNETGEILESEVNRADIVLIIGIDIANSL